MELVFNTLLSERGPKWRQFRLLAHRYICPLHMNIRRLVPTHISLASADLLLAMLERPHVQAAVAASPALGARLNTVPKTPSTSASPNPQVLQRLQTCDAPTAERLLALLARLATLPCPAPAALAEASMQLVVSVLLCVSCVTLFTQPSSSLAAARCTCAVGRDQCPRGALGLSTGGPAQPGVWGPGGGYPGHGPVHAAQPRGAWPGGLSLAGSMLSCAWSARIRFKY